MHKKKVKFPNQNRSRPLKIFRVFSIILILFVSNISFAETETGVTGQVKNSETKKPVEFCTIRVFNMKDSLITGGITDEKGFFTVALTKGKYKITSEYIGYKTDTLTVTIKTGNEFVGVIKLIPDETQLEEITISGKTQENLIDKEEFLVTSKMKTGTANTKDVLSKVNGITYDRYNNSIKVDNEDNIMILVNGLQKDQEYILNLSPDRLKKIELIRDPSGRYALEGYSAVINIILKDDYKGFEFYTEEQFLIDIDNKHNNYFPLNHFSGSLNYTYNKVNLYAKVNNSIMNFDLSSTSLKQYNNGLTITEEPKNDFPNLNMDRIYDKITAGADYYINPKHTVSFETSFTGLLFPESENRSVFNTSYFNNGAEYNNFYSETDNNSANRSKYSSVFYKGILNEKNSVNIDFTYSDSEEKYTIDYFENSALINTQEGINDNAYTKFYAEFNHTINKKSNFQSGYGNTWKKTVNIYNFGETDFIRTDKRHMFYAYYSYKFNEKIGIKIGGAAETSIPEVEGEKINYFIYQPYADVKLKPFKFLDIRLKYRSSSDYPTINQANPDTIILDENTIRVGNPYISPSVTHKLSIRLNILGGLASVEPYYHFSNNYISQIGMLNSNGIFEYSYNNAGEYEHYGLKAGLTIPLGKNLFWQNNANFFRSSIIYNEAENSIADKTFSSNLIYVNKKYKSTSGIIYQNNLKKVITAQGYNMWNNDFWGLMIQQPFLKQKVNVMIFYMLPINFGADYKQGSYIKTDDYIETNYQDISILKNMLMFRITLRLNKGKSIRKTDKDIKLEKEKEEKGGII